MNSALSSTTQREHPDGRPRAMAELDRRLKIFVNLPLASLDRLSFQSHVDEIGQSKGEE